MDLYYVRNEKKNFIGKYKDQKSALKEIKLFWESLGFAIPYFRMQKKEDYINIDFGMYNSFYELHNDKIICEHCNTTIYGEYYDLANGILCKECLDLLYKNETDY